MAITGEVINMYQLSLAHKKDHPLLLEIWESSVKATHHFLDPHDIEFYKRTIQEKQIFDLVELTVVKDIENKIIGFMGVSEDTIEMIFLHPDSRGKGIGKILLNYAINDLKLNKVDVNEQNEQALKFYLKFGFKVIARSDLDGTGKPYPILHMQRIL